MKLLRGCRRWGPVFLLMGACGGILAAPGRALAGFSQEGGGMAPLPADPPIGGPVWTVLIPAILLVGSFLATYLLYRRFSKEEG